jgi:ferredoxin-thioredoxin reductase catalytic subunit
MVEKDSAGGLRQNEAGLRLRAGYNLCPCAGVGADAVELDYLYTRCVLSVPSYEGCYPDILCLEDESDDSSNVND